MVIKSLSLFCLIFGCYFWIWLWKLHKLMFNFWRLNNGIGLKIKGFDDMGYDKGFWLWKWRCWLIFLRILRDCGEGGFFSWCVSESAIWFGTNNNCFYSFCHPRSVTIDGISIFFRLLVEQVTYSIQNYVTLFTIL